MWKSTRFRCSNACIAVRITVNLSVLLSRINAAVCVCVGGGGGSNRHKIVHVKKAVIKEEDGVLNLSDRI
jgi:hypothetical protein